MGSALTSVLPAWLRRTVGGAAEQQSSQWQLFRQAARATEYYKGANLIEHRFLGLAEFYRRHAEFLNPHAETPAPVTFEGPWEASALAKIVAASPWFRMASPVETHLKPDGLAVVPKIDVLAAPVRALLELAAAAGSARPRCAAPGYGLVAFTGISQAPLSAADRDALWRAWRAPVFEQFRGFQGELLGAECEAFSGLHFDPKKATWDEGPGGMLLVTSLVNLRHPAWRLETGRYGRVEAAECACGSDLPRVVWGGGHCAGGETAAAVELRSGEAGLAPMLF